MWLPRAETMKLFRADTMKLFRADTVVRPYNICSILNQSHPYPKPSDGKKVFECRVEPRNETVAR